MRIDKKTLVSFGILISCLVLFLAFPSAPYGVSARGVRYSAGSIKEHESTYELRPEIWTPEYRTDTARAIDAYERLMERYMDLSESNYSRIGDNIEDVIKRLDSIDRRLARLSERIARIEKGLELDPPESIGEMSTPGGQTEKDSNIEHKESEKSR